MCESTRNLNDLNITQFNPKPKMKKKTMIHILLLIIENIL